MAPEFDLSDVELFQSDEHLPVFDWLRENAPVYWNTSAGGADFWALTRYDDVLWAYRNHTELSSQNGVVMGGSYRRDRDSASGRMLVTTDLPRHRLLKEAVQPVLAAHTVERVAEQVEKLVTAAVGKLAAAGGGDFADDVANELPTAALMVIFGLPWEEARHLVGLTHRMIGFRNESGDGVVADQELRLAWTHAEIVEFLHGVLAQRRKSPGDDMASILLKTTINGRPLGEEDIIYNCINMAVGGNETSTYTASAGLHALTQWPDQHDRLQARPDLISSAIEEMLRWASTAAYVQRIALEDVVLHDVTIRAGQMVTLWNVSANRDERQFPDPYTFDVGRSPNRHVSYGTGLHRCIGAPVAQRELSLLFGVILDAGVRFRVAGRVEKHRSNFILGITHLPVEVVDSAGGTP